MLWDEISYTANNLTFWFSQLCLINVISLKICINARTKWRFLVDEILQSSRPDVISCSIYMFLWQELFICYYFSDHTTIIAIRFFFFFFSKESFQAGRDNTKFLGMNKKKIISIIFYSFREMILLLLIRYQSFETSRCFEAFSTDLGGN